MRTCMQIRHEYSGQGTGGYILVYVEMLPMGLSLEDLHRGYDCVS